MHPESSTSAIGMRLERCNYFHKAAPLACRTFRCWQRAAKVYATTTRHNVATSTSYCSPGCYPCSSAECCIAAQKHSTDTIPAGCCVCIQKASFPCSVIRSFHLLRKSTGRVTSGTRPRTSTQNTAGNLDMSKSQQKHHIRMKRTLDSYLQVYVRGTHSLQRISRISVAAHFLREAGLMRRAR